MSNNYEYLHHVHGASANEASILIDAHEAIESNDKLSDGDESLLVSLMANFRNTHLVYEYMDQFYGDSPWPALETAIAEWLTTEKNYVKKEALYNMVKPYYDKVHNIDWLIDNLIDKAASESDNTNLLAIVPQMVKLAINQSYNTENAKNISTWFTPYLEQAAEATARIFSADSIIIAIHLWDTIAAGKSQGLSGDSMIFEWALAKKLYYFKGNFYKCSAEMAGRNFLDICALVLKNKAENEKMFSMFDFEDFLDDASLIIPYSQKVLEGRFYDIEEFLKTMEYTLYKQYLESVPKFTNYWKNRF